MVSDVGSYDGGGGDGGVGSIVGIIVGVIDGGVSLVVMVLMARLVLALVLWWWWLPGLPQLSLLRYLGSLEKSLGLSLWGNLGLQGTME